MNFGDKKKSFFKNHRKQLEMTRQRWFLSVTIMSGLKIRFNYFMSVKLRANRIKSDKIN